MCQVRAAHALFGHSFGVLVACETARRPVAGGVSHPDRLLVSGVAVPCLPRPVIGVEQLSDEEFVGRLRDLVGHDHEALHDPELRAPRLPALRADVAISERYVHRHITPLPVPITVLRGTDDELVSREHAALWSRVAPASTELVNVDGGHMYFAEAPQRLRTVFDAVFAGPAAPSASG